MAAVLAGLRERSEAGLESFILNWNDFPNGNSAPNSVTQVNTQQMPSQAAFIRLNTVNEDVVDPETLNICRSCRL